MKMKQYISVTIGILLAAVAFNLFLSPYHLVAGGISGLATIVKSVLNIKESTFIFLGNLILLLVSLKCLGPEKTKNTVLGALLFPVFVSLTENIATWIPLNDMDLLIIAILGGSISGLGYGLVFQNNFTTGGTDILNQLAEKYLKIPMAKSILFVDGTIVLLVGITFGVSNMLYSFVVLYLVSAISNSKMLELNRNRVLYIKTKKVNEVKRYLMEEFHYDVTILDAVGGYSETKSQMLMCSVHNKNYYQIKEGIIIIDPQAFITVTKAYEQKNANKMLRDANG